jgi:serine/threonine-protein kinase RsbW
MTQDVNRELRIARAAAVSTPREMRHDVRVFLAAANVDQLKVDDIIAAVSEAVANSVEHAYPAGAGGEIELTMRLQPWDMLFVEVADQGSFVNRERLPDRGLGLNIIRAFAQSMEVICDRGTRIRMIFALGI